MTAPAGVDIRTVAYMGGKRLKAGTSTVKLEGRGRVKVSAPGMRPVSARL